MERQRAQIYYPRKKTPREETYTPKENFFNLLFENSLSLPPKSTFRIYKHGTQKQKKKNYQTQMKWNETNIHND